MNKTKAVKDFWNEFCLKRSFAEAGEKYQVWNFGSTREMARELADLVLSGKKTATASLPETYETKPDEKPTVGTYSVVTDFDGVPVCVVQTTEVNHVPFNEVGPEFAFDEGEGDQSLDCWRGVHSEYFSKEAFELGIEFSENSLICCERFRLVFPNEL